MMKEKEKMLLLYVNCMLYPNEEVFQKNSKRMLDSKFTCYDD